MRPATKQAGATAPRADGLVLTGLLLGVLLSALDQTVVGTSLGKIVADIGGFERFSYLFAAYMLASTVVIPLAGKLSDLYGRRPVYLTGMIVFLVGSALCGTAQTMTQLIVWRGLQGLGGGVIFPVALATVADLYAPTERGRVQGLFGAVFGLSSIVGPFLGGGIVDHVHIASIASWRWVFYVNVPVGLGAIAMVFLHFPRLTARPTYVLDYAGVATLTIALVSGLMITVWGGTTFAWNSFPIWSLAATSLLALAAFAWVESGAADPVVPFALWRQPIFALASGATLLMGAGMFAIISFMPTYMQGVAGISATNSGAVLMPLSLSLVAGSVASGRLMKRYGYKPFMLTGTLISAAGFVLLARLGDHPVVWEAVAEMMLVGLGLGFTVQTYVVATQNAVERRLIGVATGTLTLTRTLGATFGVTILGVVLNRILLDRLPRLLPAATLDRLLQDPFINGHVDRIPSLLLRKDFLGSAQPATVEAIKSAFTSGMVWVFLTGWALAVAAFAITVFVEGRPLKGAAEYGQAPAGQPAA